MKQQSERITYRGETLFIMRAAAAHATLRARSSVVSDRLNDIAEEISSNNRAGVSRVVTLDRSAHDTVTIRYGEHLLATVYHDDAELEGFVTHRGLNRDQLAEEWRERLQVAIDRVESAMAARR